MASIKKGDAVLARTGDGADLDRIAATGVVMGRDFPVVWVCSPAEWDRANATHGEPDALPWPAEDVRLAEKVGA